MEEIIQTTEIGKSLNYAQDAFFVMPTGRGYFQLFTDRGEPVKLEVKLTVENPADGLSTFKFEGICNCVRSKYEMFDMIEQSDKRNKERSEESKKSNWWNKLLNK